MKIALYIVLIIFIFAWAVYVYIYYPQQRMPIGEKVDVHTIEPEKYHDIRYDARSGNYFMAQSPYYAWDNKVENPMLYMSDDYKVWNYGVLIEDTPDKGYNSDPNICLFENGDKIYLWRECGTPQCDSYGCSRATIGGKLNKDGTLEAEETSFIEGIMSATAGEDKIIDDVENQFAASIFASQFGIADADFMGFTKSVSDAVKDIKSVKESKAADGGKIITTYYNDGGWETIQYYPDGDFRTKHYERHEEVTVNYYYAKAGNSVDNSKQYSSAQVDAEVKREYDKYKKEKQREADRSRLSDGRANPVIVNSFEIFKDEYIKAHFVKSSDTKKIDISNTIDSERYKQDKLKEEGKQIAKALYDSACEHTGAVGEDDFIAQLNKINTDNVIYVIKGYNEISPDESLFEMIYDEWASSDGDMKNALLGNAKEGINGIFSTLVERAKKSGVDDSVIKHFEDKFNEQVSSDLGGVDSWFKIDSEKIE